MRPRSKTRGTASNRSWSPPCGRKDTCRLFMAGQRLSSGRGRLGKAGDLRRQLLERGLRKSTHTESANNPKERDEGITHGELGGDGAGDGVDLLALLEDHEGRHVLDAAVKVDASRRWTSTCLSGVCPYSKGGGGDGHLSGDLLLLVDVDLVKVNVVVGLLKL
jgi:hypothetical protein